MQQSLVNKPTGSSFSNRRVMALTAIGVLVAVTSGGGLALAARSDDYDQSSPSPSSDSRHASSQTSNQASPSNLNIPAQKAASGTAGSSDVTSPGVSNTNNSSTSVTINGQTTVVGDNESVDKSYTTDDGTTHVNISVNNSSSSSGQGSTEDTMN